MLRRVEPSKGKALESINLSKEWLEEAEKNAKSKAFRSALSSAYIAMFHSARAILFRDGIREKSHYCVGVYLSDYVERGLLEAEWVSMFDRMRTARHTDQYSFDLSPTSEEVESAIDTAKSFVARMERLLKETTR
ncbi:MAG: HEPN domain-containing protein [Thermoplasmata archaeon HGW-Thermoplasmata-2]|nr:MAG: HEPN domain-containing protein [Thermoplasmata archaeon HGW-Thermoplasmata-2]